MTDLRWTPAVDVSKVLSALFSTAIDWPIRLLVTMLIIARRHWLRWRLGSSRWRPASCASARSRTSSAGPGHRVNGLCDIPVHCRSWRSIHVSWLGIDCEYGRVYGPTQRTGEAAMSCSTRGGSCAGSVVGSSSSPLQPACCWPPCRSPPFIRGAFRARGRCGERPPRHDIAAADQRVRGWRSPAVCDGPGANW